MHCIIFSVARIRSFTTIVFLVVALPASAQPQVTEPSQLVEVFYSTETPGLAPSDKSHITTGDYKYRFYPLNHIKRIERELSTMLSSDPGIARQQVLSRIQNQSVIEPNQLQVCAEGLAKAFQYGIDRSPAIVIDSKAVVYGVTNIREALQRYENWLQRQQP